MKFTYVAPHPLMPKKGCAICGGKAKYQGCFVPADRPTRIIGYPICGTCQSLAHADPSILGPLEEMLLDMAKDVDPKPSVSNQRCPESKKS